ncbi:hypothetical protein ABQF35_03735 [Mycobacterium syngnathidarum]|nr:YHS domain protein [Mycobacterium sp. DBP42]
MMFTEVFVPKGSHTREDLDRLACGLTAHGLYDDPESFGDPVAERADPGVLEFLESITHVVVHEVDTWVAGGSPLKPTDPPRYVARVYVPGPWRKALSEHLITHITRVFADIAPAPDRLYQQAHAEVHVLGVPEGGYGAFGRVVGDSALNDMINDAVRGTAEVPDGMAVDPMCGAMVRLDNPASVTADIDGTEYTFCCPGCRRAFLDRQGRQAART